MPTLSPLIAMDPSSTRRSSRNTADSTTTGGGVVGITPTSTSIGGRLSKDETALDLLRNQVLKHDFYSIKDPNDVMKKIWIRKDMDKDDAEDGTDSIRESNFTVEKYKNFWQNEMADMDEAIVDWASGNRLPSSAWAHLPEDVIKQIVIVEEKVAEVVKKPADAPAVVSSKKKTNAKKQKVPTKKRNVSDDEDDDIVGEDLHDTRKDWFDSLNDGRDLISLDLIGMIVASDNTSKKKRKMASVKEQKVQAKTLQSTFVQNSSSSFEMMSYKKMKLDPVAARVIREVDMYVAAEAASLRNDLLEDMCVTNYKFTSDEEFEAAKEKNEARLLKEVQEAFDEDDEKDKVVSTEDEKEKVSSDED